METSFLATSANIQRDTFPSHRPQTRPHTIPTYLRRAGSPICLSSKTTSSGLPFDRYWRIFPSNPKLCSGGATFPPFRALNYTLGPFSTLSSPHHGRLPSPTFLKVRYPFYHSSQLIRSCTVRARSIDTPRAGGLYHSCDGYINTLHIYACSLTLLAHPALCDSRTAVNRFAVLLCFSLSRSKRYFEQQVIDHIQTLRLGEAHKEEWNEPTCWQVSDKSLVVWATILNRSCEKISEGTMMFYAWRLYSELQAPWINRFGLLINL